MKNFYIFFLLFLFLFSFKPADCSKGKGATCTLNYNQVVKEEEKTIVGKIVCKKCDLNISEKCENVLYSSDNKIYEFCSCSKINEEIKNLEGKDVEVKGKVCTLKKGGFLIHAESFKIL
ncbi:MAG: hypothetical protein WHV67_09310 [Thermoanaerobaculia bacterium]